MAEPPHGLLEALDLLLLRDVLLPLALELELARDDVGAVVARPHPDHALVELGDLRDGGVEQVAVVGDHHDGAVEVVQQRAEALAARHVQVRLGLVEQQHVGPPRQAGGERDELALPAGELRRRHVEAPRCRAPAGARAPRPRRGRRPPRSRPPGRARGARARASSGPGRPPAPGRPGAPPPRAGRPPARASSGRASRTVASASRSSPSTICGRWARTSPRRRVTVPASGWSNPARIASASTSRPRWGRGCRSASPPRRPGPRRAGCSGRRRTW